MRTLILLYQFLSAHKRSILSFLIVGALSAVVNFSSFGLLWNWLGLNYQIAVTIAYILSVIFHFVANRRFTFQSHGTHFFRHLPKYAVMILINYLITLLIVRISVEILHLSPYIGIILAIGATVNIGYLLSRFWVFRPLVKET